MPQSSLMTWLSKPASIKEPPPAVLRQEKADQLPTPPPTQDAPGQTSKPEAERKPQTLAFSTITRPLPSQVQIRTPRADDIPSLKRLNNLLLPIPYPESFYREIATDPLTQSITLLAFWYDEPTLSSNQTPEKSKGRLIGAIRCRLLAHPLDTPKARDTAPMLYLSTLVLLSPYRHLGIAMHMFSSLLQSAVREHGIRSVGAHVWEANPEGLEWYAKRGFREVGREEGYYRRLKPQGAVVVRRDVGVGDLLGWSGKGEG